jgi:hypothetical protein
MFLSNNFGSEGVLSKVFLRLTNFYIYFFKFFTKSNYNVFTRTLHAYFSNIIFESFNFFYFYYSVLCTFKDLIFVQSGYFFYIFSEFLP